MPADPRFQDPSRFRCAVLGCARPAIGWLTPELIRLAYRSEGGRVYVCDEHAPEWWTRSAGTDGGAAR